MGDKALEKNDLILVTGVTGFIASHIANQLLQDGYRVRGTCRKTSKAAWLYELFNARYGPGKFEAVETADMDTDGAFDESVRGVQGIVHAASIMTFSSNADEVIPPTVKGALNILTAASAEPGIKAFVYTSSSTAALLPQPNKRIVVTKDTWDDDAVNKANAGGADAFTVYGASKTEAERAIWKAVEQTHPPFRVAAVLPNMNVGEVLNGVENAGSTAGTIPRLWKGDVKVFEDVVPQWMVDVKDDARLHVAALADPECDGQRIFAFAEPFEFNQVLGIFRRLRPDKEFPADREGFGADLSEIPNGSAVALLKKHYNKGFTGLEEAIKENLGSLLSA